MGSLFSKKSKSRVTEQDEAVLQLKNQRDKLKQFNRRIEVRLEKDRQIAKNLISVGKKDRALVLLKKKKYQETLIDRADKQCDNIQRMIHDIEFAQIEMQVVDNLKQGNQVLHKLNTLMSIEDVESILEDTKEAVEYQQEIERLISNDLSLTDMKDVEDELNQLLNQQQNDIILPEVPQDQLPQDIVEKVKPEKREAEPEALLA